MATQVLDRLRVEDVAETDQERLAFEAIRFIVRRSTLVPVLYGMSSVGKTRFAQRIAEALGAEFIVLLLQNGKPDDIAGCQIMTLEGDLRPTLPWWFVRAREVTAGGRPVVILLDELNLAREEVRGAMLTFMRDRTVYNQPLDGDVVVLGACNEGQFAEAFRKRCVFIHWKLEVERMRRIAGASTLAEAVVSLREARANQWNSDQRYFPPAPEAASLATVDLLARGESDLYRMDEETRGYVLRLLLPEDEVEAVLERLARPHSTTAAVFLEQPQLLREQIQRLPASDAAALLASVLQEALAKDRYAEALALMGFAQVGAAESEDGAEKLAALLKLPDELAARMEQAVRHLERYGEHLPVDGLLEWPVDGNPQELPKGGLGSALRALAEKGQ